MTEFLSGFSKKTVAVKENTKHQSLTEQHIKKKEKKLAVATMLAVMVFNEVIPINLEIFRR